MPRDGAETKKLILKSASKLFYEEGIRAVSVDAVAAKAGITKKSLYYHFQSKDDLVTGYLQSRDQPNMNAFQKWFHETDGSIADKVFAIFKGVAENSKKPRWRGCGFLRTAGELANQLGHPAFKAGAAHKKRFEKWLEDEFQAEGIKEAPVIARRVVILMDGAFATSLVHRDPDYILEAGNVAHALISSA